MIMGSRSEDHKNWVRTVIVSEPRRHRKGFTVYKVTSKVFLKAQPAGVTTLSVWKRYNDFKKLYTELEQIHRQLYLPGKFPEFPKGSVFSRFEYEVVEERKAAALSLLQFAANHVQLFTAKVFNKFFEDGYDTKDLLNYSCSNPTETTSQLTSQASETCLVPERLWKPSPTGVEKQIGEDEIVSVMSGDSDTETPVSDSDSMLSGSVFSSSLKNPNQGSRNGSSYPIAKSHSVDFSISSFLGNSNQFQEYTMPNTSPTCNPIYNGSTTHCRIENVDSNIFVTPAAEVCSSSSGVSTDSFSSQVLGLFDFLPKFPKRDKQIKIAEEKLLCEALSSSYICEAAGHFAVAQDHEFNGSFPEAFSSYKEGIRILLDGAKNDTDEKRKELVKKKLEKYLSHAEIIHEGPLSVMSRNSTSGVSSNLQSPARNFLRMELKVTKNALTNMPVSPLIELEAYKIVGIMSRKIYVVMNLGCSTGSRCYAMKVLPIPSCPIDPTKKTAIPIDIPFMVQLFKWFETEYSYILLLQFAGGGRLIDYIESYQRKPIPRVKFEPEVESEESGIEGTHIFRETNAKATIQPSSFSISVPASSEVNDEQENSNSYTKLLLDYSESGGSDDVTKFARIPLAPFTTNQLKTTFRDMFKVDTELLDHIREGNVELPIQPHQEPEYSTKSTADDLIENSKQLLTILDETLQKERDVEKRVVNSVKRKRYPKFAGDFLSKSMEDIGLVYTVGEVFQAHNPGVDGQIKINRNECTNTAAIETLCELKSPVTSTEEGEDQSEIKRTVPEGCIKGWAAEMIICLAKLHSFGFIYRDLAMENILLGENGHILVSFKASWSKIDQYVFPVTNSYSAPEIVQNLGDPCWKLHPSCDFWSLGAILFELFTGQTVQAVHPEGFHPQTVIQIPERNILGELISTDVRSLLTELLEIKSTMRLGFYGAEEIKTHPCFDGFDWENAYELHS